MKFLLYILILHVKYMSIGTTDTDHRIIGGRPALEGELPYQVSIRRSYNDKHFCGGTLISGDVIVTAAHCMYYTWGGLLPPIIVSVVGGQNNLTINSQSVYRNASNIIVHEDFDMDSFKNDIAIIKVSESFPINVSKFISIVPLQKNNLNSGSCTVSGWGVQEVNTMDVSEILLAVDVNIINMTDCVKKYRVADITLSDGMLCAGHSDKEKDACQGDSGGPLICNGYLTGIVSTGKGCADPKYPGIYTNVADFNDWIRNVINKLANESVINDVNEGVEKLVFDNNGKSFLDTLFIFNNSSMKFVPNHLILFIMIFIFTLCIF